MICFGKDRARRSICFYCGDKNPPSHKESDVTAAEGGEFNFGRRYAAWCKKYKAPARGRPIKVCVWVCGCGFYCASV